MRKNGGDFAIVTVSEHQNNTKVNKLKQQAVNGAF